jgi:RHS repeat-associated protein
VTNHYRYSPYGVDHAYGAGSNSHTFDGKLSAGPFMILGARIYEPAVGRFLSPDPFLVLTNQYTYTSGNAVLFSDAAGLVEVSRSQQFAIAKAAGWVLMAAAFAFNPPASAIALWLGVGGFSVTGGVFFSELVGAFAPDSGTIPTAPPPSAPPPPPPSGPPSDGSDSGIQIKVVVVSVGEAPVQSCSPSQLSGAIASRRLLPGLLLVNLAFGIAVWWRRRRKALE